MDTGRCFTCEEVELANARDRRPSQVLPIPRAAVEGFPEGRSAPNLTRRRLLQLGAAGFASVYGPRLLGWQNVWESAVADAAAGDRAIVLLYLAGGQDGLNAIVPTAAADYSIYAARRPHLARGMGATTSGRVGSRPIPGLDGALSFANPLVSSGGGGDNKDAAHGFDVLYGDGSGGPGSDLALLPAVDYTPANLSHFTSADYWFAGDTEYLSTGWLGRFLDVYGSDSNPLQGISLGSALSKALLSQSAPVCTISSLTTPGFTGAGLIKPTDTLRQLAAIPASGAGLEASRESYARAGEVGGTLSALGKPALGSGYPTGTLGDQLRTAAYLLGAGLGTRVITIHWGSFDTHGRQLSRHDPQLVQLSRALGAFVADLKTRGLDQQVSVLAFSEFGRRLAENSAAGTDHGAGGLMALAGTPVNGGLAGEFPGLTSLDPTGNLFVPTDFRQVYAETIAWLGGDPQQVLPGGPWEPVRRGDGRSGLFH